MEGCACTAQRRSCGSRTPKYALAQPKVNARRVDPRWKPDREAAGTCVKSVCSVQAGAGLRWGQVTPSLSLRLSVALNVLAHTLKFLDISG